MFSWIASTKYRLRAAGAVALMLVLAGQATIAFAQDAPAAATEAAPAAPPAPDSGDTAWMLTSTALVLFMTIPGLSLFYAGLVRSKNVLSVLMQCFALTALISVIWLVVGYTLSFSAVGMAAGTLNLNSFIGGFDKLFLLNIMHDGGRTALWMTMPESVWIVYQLTFAIITPALIVGAFAERMKFSAMLVFSALWSILVYSPICHMVWGGAGAFLFDKGALDFAGGTVVHINAGIAALVCALVLGPRKGFPDRAMPPHNLAMAVTGAGMLWVGWFGFNAGSAGAANAAAGMAMLTTHMATAVAALTWMAIEWVKNGKPSVLGVITGAVAGLVAITPASGTTGVPGAVLIGVGVSVGCFIAATSVKKAFGYDDSLDAFGVHGVGGIIGAILTGVGCAPWLGGAGFGTTPGGPIAGMAQQLGVQAMSVGITVVITGVVSFVLLKLIDLTIGLRVTAEEEEEGLDLALHGEEGYHE